MLLIFKLLLNMTVADPTYGSYGSDIDITHYDPGMFTTPSYREVFLDKLNQIVTTGFTIEEFQKAMIIL